MNTYLFVCRSNKMRSVCCANYFSDLLKDKGICAKIESAGLRVSDPKKSFGHIPKQATREMFDIANRIFVMEEWMNYELRKDYGVPEEKIINLDILDLYEWFDDNYRIYVGRKSNIESMLPLILIRKTEKEQNTIRNRVEVIADWSLKRVLQYKHLEQYILPENNS